MSEEHPAELSPEKIAQLRSATENIVQYVRQALAVGTSLEFLKTALVAMGFSRDLVETMIERQRDQLRREASVDRDFEVANTLARFELLYTLAVRETDYKTALNVLRERVQFTGSAQFMKYSTREPSRAPSEFEKAYAEIGGVQRERIRMEVERKILALAKELREKDAAENKRVVDNENQKRSQ